MDFAHLKDTVVSVISITDHCLLNDIKGLENPTCELLAVWLWKKLKPVLPLLKKIELKEIPTAGVVYWEM